MAHHFGLFPVAQLVSAPPVQMRAFRQTWKMCSLSTYIVMYIYIYLSLSRSLHPSIHLSIYRSIYLSIHPSIYISIDIRIYIYTYKITYIYIYNHVIERVYCYGMRLVSRLCYAAFAAGFVSQQLAQRRSLCQEKKETEGPANEERGSSWPFIWTCWNALKLLKRLLEAAATCCVKGCSRWIMHFSQFSIINL